MINMNCRVCYSNQLEIAIDLGEQPWANHFLRKEEIGKEPYYPLRVVFCHECKTAQLDYTVKKEIMFSNHTYLSGITRSLSEHFKSIAVQVDKRFFKNEDIKSVMDIGSNDGTQLKHYKDLGYRVLGIESSGNIAKIANESGIPTINNFFNLELSRKIGRKFNVINASGIFFHLEELHSATEGIREALTKSGVFIVQFLYMKRIMENLAFDQIYHEHLLYYNLNTIEVLLNLHGLSMFDAYLAPIHGGSIIGFVTHRDSDFKPSDRLQALREVEVIDKSNDFPTYLAFADRIKQVKADNLSYLYAAKRQGKSIFGMGAPVKGNTLLNYFGIGTDYLDCLVEKNELRRGLYSPGKHIPIVIEREVQTPPDIYYVLAWNFKNEILANNRDLLERGTEFYFPVNQKDF